MAPSPDPEVMHKLAGVELFSHLDDASLRQIARLSVQRAFDTGSLVLREGSVGLGMLVITRGRVEVFAREDQEKLSIAELGSGAVVGEMALIDQQPRSASAVALEPTEVLLLTREGFRRLVDRHPRIAWSLVPTLVDRLRDLQDRLIRVEGSGPMVATAEVGRQLPAPPPRPLEPPPLEQPPISQNGPPFDGLLRLPAAMFGAGVAGLTGSLCACQGAARALGDELDLKSARPLGDLARSLPQGLLSAGREVFDHGRRMPRRVMDSFIDDLRGGRG